MTIRPIITDEQLRDFRDGILPDAERRLVAIQVQVDETVSGRFSEIKKEISGLRFVSPSIDFSTRIMAQLTAENLVQVPVYRKRSQLVIKGFFVVLSVLFIGCLLFLLKINSATTVGLPEINLQFNWAKIINGRAFLWSIWLGCLLPAILLAHQQFDKQTDMGFGKINLP